MDRTADYVSTYAAALSYGDLRQEALHAVKRSLIDSIGCALGAYAAEPVKITRALAAQTSATTPASLWGTRIKTTPEMAALVNGIMVRYLDFNDDYLNKDGPHPSDNIPAVFAVAEALHVDGKALASGIVLAYEIVDQLVDNAPFRTRGWDYVTETSIGSALGAGKILGLSKERMGHALALAIAPNIALRQTRAGELSMWKGCAGPNGARNGLFAALLAGEGMTGPADIFEGQYGLWKQVTGPFELANFGGGTRPFKIEETFFKSIPAMYTSMCAFETALKLRGQVAIDDIEAITIDVDEFSLATGDSPAKHDPHTRETADHSTPYLVAVALLDGEISESTFTAERYRRPQVLNLLRKLTMREDLQFTQDWPKTFHCRIDVRGRSGQRWTEHHTNPKGHPRNPMSDNELEQKFLELTDETLGAKQARSTLELVWRLEEISDVGEICESVVVPN
jgi:2-methylcitrate dehydratase